MKHRALLLLATGLAIGLLLGRTRAHGEDPARAPARLAIDAEVALLSSATTGDPLLRPLVERGSSAVAPVVSFLTSRIPEAATSLARVAESDRASVLRAECVLARLGNLAVPHLTRALEAEPGGARRAALARALGRASGTALAQDDLEAAGIGAQALARLLEPGARVAIPAEELLYSGRATEPREDPDALARALGALAPAAVSFVAPYLDHADPTTRALAARALAHSTSRRDAAAQALGHALEHASDPADRAHLGTALGELGGEAAALALERALLHGPPSEARDRIRDLETTANSSMAPQVLARDLERLDAGDRARAFEAMARLALPPPPPPKARFVADPFHARRSRDSRASRQAAREAATAALESDPDSLVRRAAAACLEALGPPDEKPVAKALASRVLATFETEGAARAEIARALVVLVPPEVLTDRFRLELERALAPAASPAAAALVLGDAGLAVAPEVEPDPAARDRLIEAILDVVVGDAGLDLPVLERVVRDGSLEPRARARAAASLARGGTEGLARLDSIRETGDPIARSCAAAARASGLRGEPAQELALEAEALARGTPVLARRAAVAALAYAGQKATIGFVQGLARNDPSPAVRLEGTHALARVQGKGAANVLAQALGDASPTVRRAAALELARLAVPDQGVPNSLVAAIARSRKLPDREAAALEEQLDRTALAALGKDSVPALAGPARGAGDPVERLVAIAQLSRLATDEAIAVLVGIVREPKTRPDDRDAAARAICHATGRDLADSMWDELRKP